MTVTRNLLVVGLLTAVWVALWGELTPANVLSGIATAVLTLVALPLERPQRRGAFRLLPALGYGLWFAKELVVANVEVAWEVVTPRNRDNEGIIAVPLAASCSRTVMMLIVNSIGLTPGTVVVEIADDPRTLYVHVLHLDDAEAARARLADLATRALHAFGSEDSRREQAALAPAPRRTA